MAAPGEADVYDQQQSDMNTIIYGGLREGLAATTFEGVARLLLTEIFGNSAALSDEAHAALARLATDYLSERGYTVTPPEPENVAGFDSSKFRGKE